MRLKLDIKELRTFRTKHTINDLKTKKIITQSLCGFPFNEANRGSFFSGGGSGGGRRAEGNWCIEMGQNVSSPAGLCCVLAF